MHVEYWKCDGCFEQMDKIEYLVHVTANNVKNRANLYLHFCSENCLKTSKIDLSTLTF